MDVFFSMRIMRGKDLVGVSTFLKLLAAFDLNPQRMVAYDFGRGIISSSYHQI